MHFIYHDTKESGTHVETEKTVEKKSSKKKSASATILATIKARYHSGMHDLSHLHGTVTAERVKY